MKTSLLSLSAAALSILGTVACGEVSEEKGSNESELGKGERFQCTALPHCEEGETEVEAGSEGAREVTLCGTTISCAPGIAVCTAYPSCAPNESEVDANTEGARAVSLCGQTIYCADLVQCAAVPQCADGEIEVDANTEGARPETMCGATIYCAPDPEPQPEDPCPACGLG